jgi:hypothetical protein
VVVRVRSVLNILMQSIWTRIITPATPYDRILARKIKTLAVMLLCALFGILIAVGNSIYYFIDQSMLWIFFVLIFGFIGFPYFITQILKMRCPRCGTHLIGEGNPGKETVKFYRVPKTCFNCRLDLTAEFPEKSDWKNWT